MFSLGVGGDNSFATEDQYELFRNISTASCDGGDGDLDYSSSPR